MIYDYLLIGQGLAGSTLAYQLTSRGKTVMVIDENQQFTSSKVAAGLVNPFTGPRMVKSWKVEELIPYMERFYRELEQITKASFLKERVMYRPFNSVEHLNDWTGRSAHPNYQKFLLGFGDDSNHDKYVHDEHGGIEIKSFVLNVPLFISEFRDHLLRENQLITGVFDEEQLILGEEHFQYKDLRFTNLVFCNGYKVIRSKYFSWLPMAPVKGEILFLKMKNDFETIYNRSCFIIPQGKFVFRAGSTYVREVDSESPTESGKNEIRTKLNSLLKSEYEIVGHEAGIRPGTIPRRPLLGRHPEFNNMFVFNGLGTKGVSLAPYFSDQFANYLENKEDLDEEVDIKKYYSLYFKSQVKT